MRSAAARDPAQHEQATRNAAGCRGSTGDGQLTEAGCILAARLTPLCGGCTRAGVRYRILRNGLYADLLLPMLQEARSTGQLSVPVDAGSRVAAVARDDLARAYVPLLTASAADGEVEILTGDRVSSFEEIAEMFGAILGRRVRFERISPQAHLERLWQRGTPDWLTHALHTQFIAIEEDRFAVTNRRIEELTGQAPRPLADALARLATETERRVPWPGGESYIV